MSLFSRRTYVVKERVAVLKLTDTYDLIDPETQMVIGTAKDEPVPWLKYARLLVKKGFLPTTVNVYEGDAAVPSLSLSKGMTFLRAVVKVKNAGGSELGFFKSKLFSLGGGFWVFTPDGQQFAEVKGDWKGWNFRFLDSAGQELGQVTKKWAGLGKELFTSADTYVISVGESIARDPDKCALLLAAGLAIDTVFKEK